MALRRGHLECGANCWPDAVTSSQHVYVVGPRKDKRGVDLISDALPIGRLWYGEPNAVRQRSWLREVSQPLIGCGDSRLR
jgi:hypothetical protein